MGQYKFSRTYFPGGYVQCFCLLFGIDGESFDRSPTDYFSGFFCIIILQLETWQILNIIYFRKTNCTGLSFIVVWYVLHIPYVAADSTTVQSNSKYSDFSNTMVRTMFSNV